MQVDMHTHRVKDNVRGQTGATYVAMIQVKQKVIFKFMKRKICE